MHACMHSCMAMEFLWVMGLAELNTQELIQSIIIIIRNLKLQCVIIVLFVLQCVDSDGSKN